MGLQFRESAVVVGECDRREGSLPMFFKGAVLYTFKSDENQEMGNLGNQENCQQTVSHRIYSEESIELCSNIKLYVTTSSTEHELSSILQSIFDTIKQ